MVEISCSHSVVDCSEDLSWATRAVQFYQHLPLQMITQSPLVPPTRKFSYGMFPPASGSIASKVTQLKWRRVALVMICWLQAQEMAWSFCGSTKLENESPEYVSFLICYCLAILICLWRLLACLLVKFWFELTENSLSQLFFKHISTNSYEITARVLDIIFCIYKIKIGTLKKV